MGVLAALLVSSLGRDASGAPGVQGIDFQGIDFQGIDFQGIDFQGIDFQGIDFQGIDFQSVDLDASVLVFDGLAFEGTEFSTVSIEGTDVVAFRHVGIIEGNSVWEQRHLDHSKVWTVAPDGSTHTVEHAHGLSGAVIPAELVIDGDLRLPLSLTIGDVVMDTTYNTMRDPDALAFSANTDLLLVELFVAVDDGAGSSIQVNICGDRPGLFVRGRWTLDGGHDDQGVSFTCVDGGVVAKCIRNWGYKPWKSLPHPSGVEVALHPLYQACVRAARADYCGDGTSHTRDGTPIDLWDSYGFNMRSSEDEIARFMLKHGVDQAPAFVTESVFDMWGTVLHHIERFPSDTLACVNEIREFRTPEELDEEFISLGASEELIAVSSNQVGREPSSPPPPVRPPDRTTGSPLTLSGTDEAPNATAQAPRSEPASGEIARSNASAERQQLSPGGARE